MLAEIRDYVEAIAGKFPICQIYKERNDDIHDSVALYQLVLILLYKREISDDQNDRLQMVDQCQFRSLLMQDCNEFLPFLAQLIDCVPFLLLLFFGLAPALAWPRRLLEETSQIVLVQKYTFVLVGAAANFDNLP